MYSYQQVTTLRKGRNLDEAERLAQKELATTPYDRYLQNSYGWILYERLKNAGSLLETNQIPP